MLMFYHGRSRRLVQQTPQRPKCVAPDARFLSKPHRSALRPIERVWWHLHEEITRNHRCQNIDELVDLVFDWFGYKECFEVETSIYPQTFAA